MNTVVKALLVIGVLQLGVFIRIGQRLGDLEKKVVMQDAVNENFLKKMRSYDNAAHVLHDHIHNVLPDHGK